MGLPLLEAMQPATSLAAAANPSHPTRAAFVFFPNGAIMPAWTPSSWKTKTALQQPQYDEPAELEAVVRELSERPPLVTSWEVERLKSQLSLASCGGAFF